MLVFRLLMLCIVVSVVPSFRLVPQNNSEIEGFLTFVSDRDGDLEIFLLNIDTAETNQLTTNSTADFSPDWSPDGTQIVYVSDD